MKKIFLGSLVICSLLTASFNLELTPVSVQQGNSFIINLTTGLNVADSKISYNKKDYSFYKIATDNYKIILGTTYEATPGEQEILVKLFDKKNNLLAEQSVSLNVLKKDFRFSVLKIAPERKEATDRTALQEENVLLGKAFRQKTADNYREGRFLIPCEYLRISSEYGVQRVYTMEDKEVGRWGHKGIDFSNVPGIFIFAANSGKVVISKNMQVHGKTIVIDHGQGILSAYNHLSQRFVKPGQYVKKGDAIGRIGLTGLITGAHLHFGLSVNNVRVDPMEWFEREF